MSEFKSYWRFGRVKRVASSQEEENELMGKGFTNISREDYFFGLDAAEPPAAVQAVGASAQPPEPEANTFQRAVRAMGKDDELAVALYQAHTFEGVAHDMMRERDALQAENQRLRDALAPFAEIYAAWFNRPDVELEAYFTSWLNSYMMYQNKVKRANVRQWFEAVYQAAQQPTAAGTGDGD